MKVNDTSSNNDNKITAISSRQRAASLRTGDRGGVQYKYRIRKVRMLPFSSSLLASVTFFHAPKKERYKEDSCVNETVTDAYSCEGGNIDGNCGAAFV